MKVTLLSNTQLYISAKAIRNCHNNHDKSDTIYKDGETIIGEKDRTLIDRVGNKMFHSSTLEHLVYSFQIEGISRAVLQELARTRISSLTVKSSRYTMSKELKNEEPFCWVSTKEEIEDENIYTILDEAGINWTIPNYEYNDAQERAEKYIVHTEDKSVNFASLRALENLRLLVKKGISNDVAKYCLPESYKTSLTWTINLRSLQNVLKLRLNKSALWEFQDLCCKIVRAMPKEHLFLIEGIVKEQIDGNQRIKKLIEVFD
jgi:thymidylate synthase (FAD)